MNSTSCARGKLSLTIVEAAISPNALPSVVQSGAFQSYISIVYNKNMFKTACSQGNLGSQNPTWYHKIDCIEVNDPKFDCVFITVFASQLGGNQFKSIGTTQVRLDLFTANGKQVSDGWIDLPQQMGKVRLTTEYVAFDMDLLYMEGVKNPLADSDEEPPQENHDEDNPELDSDEETKDQKSGNSNSSKYAHLPTIDQLLEKNGYGNKFGQQQTKEDVEMMDEEAVEPNLEFVKAFDNFGTFNKAACYIEDWIRNKKNNATDFTNDFPAVLDRGKMLRNCLLKIRNGQPACSKDGMPLNPEIRNVHQLILTKQICETEDAYVFNFTLNLLEACSSKSEVPLLVIRIAINHIGILISDQKLKLTPQMQQAAKEKLGTLRAEVVYDFVKHMGLSGIVDEKYFLQLAQDNLDNAKFSEAATLIVKFRFFDKFDILQLIYELVENKRVPTAKLLIDNMPQLKEKVVRMLSTNLHAKTAADLVKDYKLSPEDFPELQAIISRNSSCYFIGRAFRAPSHADYMPLHKIEDLFTDNHRMLLELVQSLLRRGMMNNAVGVYLRHQLEEHCPEALRQEIQAALHNYDSNEDQKPADQFGPTSGSQCLRLPQDVRVNFVGTDKECEKLRSLIGKELIGMDSEWRPQMTKFDIMRPALLQLSDEHNAYLIDLVSLANSQVLDQVLTELFTNEKTICIGFSFKSDMDVFAKHLPKMNFYKYMRNFIDAQTYYSKVFVAGQQTGLAKVASEVLRFEICKGEQMSNWEKRPMRLSQQHYAALDAYCLIPIMKELARRAQQSGNSTLSLKNNVHSLRWTGGKGANDLQSYQGGGFNSTTGSNSTVQEKTDRNKRTKKRADQRRNNKNNSQTQQSNATTYAQQQINGFQQKPEPQQNQYHYQNHSAAQSQQHQQQMYIPNQSNMSSYYQ